MIALLTVPRRTLTMAVAAALILTTPAIVAPALANAVQRDANRQSKDRWTRTAPASPHSSSDSDDDDSGSHHHHSSDLTPGHEGELNGHLHMHGW